MGRENEPLTICVPSFFVLQEGLIVNIKPRDGGIEEQQANEGAEKESNGY
jgi:hypothetical protein